MICLPLYGFLCITALDPQTGFLAEGLPATLFYVALFVFPVLMILCSYLQKKRLTFSISNSRVLSVLSFALGGVMIAGAVVDVIGIVAVVVDSLSYQSGSLLLSVLLLSSLQIVMALISGLVFLRLGISYLLENIANRGSMTFIFPVVWALITCVEMFRDYPQIAGMPERTLYLLCLLAFTLFLMGQSRILSDVDFKKGCLLDQRLRFLRGAVWSDHDCRGDRLLFDHDTAALRRHLDLRDVAVLPVLLV